MMGWARDFAAWWRRMNPTVEECIAMRQDMAYERRAREMELLPLDPGPARLDPPKGFRFGTEPPDMNELVHLDNDHLYVNARRGETLIQLKSYMDRTEVRRGRVIGRMGSKDYRANVVGSETRYPPEGMAGLYVEWPDGTKRWEPCQYMHRQNDGSLTYIR